MPYRRLLHGVVLGSRAYVHPDASHKGMSMRSKGINVLNRPSQARGRIRWVWVWVWMWVRVTVSACCGRVRAWACACTGARARDTRRFTEEQRNARRLRRRWRKNWGKWMRISSNSSFVKVRLSPDSFSAAVSLNRPRAKRPTFHHLSSRPLPL